MTIPNRLIKFSQVLKYTSEHISCSSIHQSPDIATVAEVCISEGKDHQQFLYM